jgi:hypothetical protein
MAKICEFGTAPEMAKAGYHITSTTVGTDAGVLAEHEGRDVCLVRGPAIFGEDGKFEFAVMGREHSIQVKHWDAYADNALPFTHQIDIEDQRASHGQLCLAIGSLEGHVDDMLSLTAEVSTNPENGADQVPAVHIHFDSNALAFSAFKVNDKIVLRLEEGVSMEQFDTPAGRLYLVD